MWCVIPVLWACLGGLVMTVAEEIPRATFKAQEECRLTVSTDHLLVNGTRWHCASACVEKQQIGGGCAAYQWDEAARTCRLQDTLNLTRAGSAERVMVRTERECRSDADCPPHHGCRAIGGDLTGNGVKFECVAADCAAILAAGACRQPPLQSGVYTIHAGSQQLREVWCDMVIDGGGWTVFLKRQDGSVDFDRKLADYKAGFGNVDGEYWLGLDTLHSMTTSRRYQLRARVNDWGYLKATSSHEYMTVASEAADYVLKVGVFTGGAGGDGFMAEGNGMKFSAKDFDNDLVPQNCAERKNGGFWFSDCSSVHPTGLYYVGGAYSSATKNGIHWVSWSTHNDVWYSMKVVVIMLRPVP